VASSEEWYKLDAMTDESRSVLLDAEIDTIDELIRHDDGGFVVGDDCIRRQIIQNLMKRLR
jgi:hypothetical protein